ncbi:MAG: putative glycoside hydrolase [Spirochaetes bacterium]|nr:putative glycoside hydrolase [Spirochaetota bacterium]
MKRVAVLFVLCIAIVAILVGFEMFGKSDTQVTVEQIKQPIPAPEFYKGIYLNSQSGRNMNLLKNFIIRAKDAGFNAVVIDAHNETNNKFLIPKESVDYVVSQGFYPIARVVMFPDGLKVYPVPEELIKGRLELAKKACEVGFREIQFDYIRFNDHGILKHIPLQERYNTIEGFLARAKSELQPYNVKIACDIFGRVPLNTNDIIGQRMEGLDPIVDVICPMAYPSHYTWSKKLMADPYYTVFITAKRAKERTKNAQIVMYIQAFKIRVAMSGLSFQEYMAKQIQAVHDAGVKGFIWWNASQQYDEPFAVTKQFYSNFKAQNISKADNNKKEAI